MTFANYLKDTFGINEPIYVEDISFENYSRPWIFRELKKLTESGELKRFDKGIYYFPEKRVWGDSVLDSDKIVMPRFITDGKEVYGYIAGLSLMNKAGLSTQVPNLTEIVTNKETTRVRDVYIGYRRIRARRSRTTITKENVRTLQFLDLMNSIIPKEMGELERFMLSRYIKDSGVTREAVTKYAGFYPARATKNMMESGAVYELAQ